jgi:hypothetical protein
MKIFSRLLPLVRMSRGSDAALVGALLDLALHFSYEARTPRQRKCLWDQIGDITGLIVRGRSS